MSSVNQFLNDRIAITKAMIIKYEAAIDFLVDNPTESYKLDTGQSEQEVKRHNVNNLQDKLETLYTRLDGLGARFEKKPVVNAPAW